MKVERRRNQQQPRGLAQQLAAGEIAVGLELAAFHVPLDAHPIIQRLQRKMNVFGSFQLDHRQPPAMIDGQQIQHAPVGGGERGNLAIDGRRQQAGVDLLNVAPYLRFEPGFGVLAIERISAVGCIGRSQP